MYLKTENSKQKTAKSNFLKVFLGKKGMKSVDDRPRHNKIPIF